MSRAGCPVVGNGGFHSESYGEDGDGACKFCGDKPIIRFCPMEDPPDICYRGCGMGPCELVVAGLEQIHKCYSCGDKLDFVPSAQPALCGKCDNLP